MTCGPGPCIFVMLVVCTGHEATDVLTACGHGPYLVMAVLCWALALLLLMSS